MLKRKFHIFINTLIASIWLINGLFCKVLDLVPRHKLIVAEILQLDQVPARNVTIFIGLAETLMAAWIFTGIRSRLNAISQIIIVAMMNTIEFICVPDLLLWGKLNSLFAFILILAIAYNEFALKPQIDQ